MKLAHYLIFIVVFFVHCDSPKKEKKLPEKEVLQAVVQIKKQVAGIESKADMFSRKEIFEHDAKTEILTNGAGAIQKIIVEKADTTFEYFFSGNPVEKQPVFVVLSYTGECGKTKYRRFFFFQGKVIKVLDQNNLENTPNDMEIKKILDLDALKKR